MARRALPRDARVRGVVAAAGRATGSRRERLFALLEQATSFYERYLWDSAAGAPAREYLASRDLGEEICHEYRLGLAPGGQTLARKAREKGFTPAELAAAGLVNRRGNDYFSGRLLFPLADARGRVRGFQARKLREDDPLRAKYVNSPEGELFRKGDMLYGLDKARAAIAKQERAIVVEGNPDVLALRQAGIEPVVAPMGTALTERQLKELSRLTHKAYLCFDGDAAGEAATLRGMELAAAQGFDVRVVTLPPGSDPADEPEGFEARLAARRELPRSIAFGSRSSARPTGRRRSSACARRSRPSRTHPNARTPCASPPTCSTCRRRPQAGLAPGRRGSATGEVSPKLLEAGDRLERDALAGVARPPGPAPRLAELDPEHFDSELHRRARAHLLEPGEPDEELVPLLAELDARAAESGIDEETAKELLLRLRERQLRRELATPISTDEGAARAARAHPRDRGHPHVAAATIPRAEHRSPVAQLAEHPAVNRRVVGSSPTRGATTIGGMREAAFVHASGVPLRSSVGDWCGPGCGPEDVARRGEATSPGRLVGSRLLLAGLRDGYQAARLDPRTIARLPQAWSRQLPISSSEEWHSVASGVEAVDLDLVAADHEVGVDVGAVDAHVP